MKLLLWVLVAQTAAKQAVSKAHHQTLSSWGHNASALPSVATSSSKAVSLRKTAAESTTLLALDGAQHKQFHSMRVCNAYPYRTAVDMYRGQAPREVTKLTSSTGPLPYRRCFDLKSVGLESGDRLDFRIGEVHLGSFAVTDVPTSPGSMLLLVFYRNDRMSTSMKFVSHAFEDKYQPQIAVIDTYHGPVDSWIQLSDRAHVEDVPYNNVITVSTGTYEVKLANREQGEQNKAMLIDARSHQTYVLMRTGVKAFEGPSYPEQLVTFPGGWSSKALVEKLSSVAFILIFMSLWL
eukprot:gnl/MRDRNA2_/MRDRNA2_65753_c0_seq1.p1 gnl/MRDRNA2_/MRDRNA2_65753_c0~~gnl/MRDRNA2_/MRDRNA2_65753_c0_seq1.p1  ORF type:complete len:293 (+),score=38.63 gnl/MRDRNA2_/MRDRNA2_65753_c0_seq1:144-1022(+)